jgi:hypothetical protein
MTTNIYIIYQVIYAGILKSKQAAAWAGLTMPMPDYSEAGLAYCSIGQIITQLGWHNSIWPEYRSWAGIRKPRPY